MNRTEPTASQEAFVQSNYDTKIIFGSRQIGKSTALALDAVAKARDSRVDGPIGVTAPTMAQGRSLLDRCRDIAFEQVGQENIETSTLAEIVLPGGTSIQYVSTSSLYMSEENMHPSRAEEFEYLVVDEVDFVDTNAIDSIIDEWKTGTVRGLSFAGTARTDSPVIKGLVKDSRWFSVYDTLSNFDMVDPNQLAELMDSAAPEQAVTEYLGLFVSDPAEDADVVRAERVQ